MSGYFDTRWGNKKESESYKNIVQDLEVSPEEVVFVSDVTAELEAAETAGLNVVLSVRPGNAPVVEGHGFEVITNFEELR